MATEEVTATEQAPEKLSGRSRRAETGWERRGDRKGTFHRREGETGGLGRVLHDLCDTGHFMDDPDQVFEHGK